MPANAFEQMWHVLLAGFPWAATVRTTAPASPFVITPDWRSTFAPLLMDSE